MTGTLTVHDAGPGLTVQDPGRAGMTAQGLSTGGACDRLALQEAAALLGSDPANAVIEMMGFGGVFSVDTPTRIALTGAVMQATIDGAPLAANRTYVLPRGVRLTIKAAKRGVFGYLAFAGGIRTPRVMDSRAAHLTAGIGKYLQAGDRLPFGDDLDPQRAPLRLPDSTRLDGGMIRFMAGPQTDLFDRATLDTFTTTRLTRSAHGNRQGVRLDHDSGGFAAAGGLSLVSDLIVPGDIQITGAGVPYVLLAECQTIGGYPRIGNVIPADLPKIAQAAPQTALQFTLLQLEDADATAISADRQLRELANACEPVVRDPHDIDQLLGYQLISGATRGDDLERP